MFFAMHIIPKKQDKIKGRAPPFVQDDNELSEGITGVSETFKTFSIHCVWSATLTPANIPSRLDCLGFFFAVITGSET